MQNNKDLAKLAVELGARVGDLVDGGQLLLRKIDRELGDRPDVVKVENAAIGRVGSWGELHSRTGLVVDHLKMI